LIFRNSLKLDFSVLKIAKNRLNFLDMLQFIAPMSVEVNLVGKKLEIAFSRV